MFGTQFVDWDTFYVSQSSTFTVSSSQTLANCSNGSITINSISGGVPPYSYSWSNGANTQSIAGLTSGAYSLLITDASGCSESFYYWVNTSMYLNVNFAVTNATCLNNNGSLMAFALTGTPPYSYLWSTGNTTNEISNMPAGNYQVIVTDANGCTRLSQKAIGTTSPVVATYTSTPSLCTSPTGSATLNVNGGTSPYSISWSIFPIQTGTTLSNVAPGNYSFHIVDAVGCIRNGTVIIPPISPFSVTLSSSPAICTLSNGSISSSITGGSSPFTYAWSTGTTSPTLSAQPAGTYSVTVTDNMGCTKSAEATINSSTPITIGLAVPPATCIFANDGSVNAIAFGGTAPYTWSGMGSSPSGLASGSYYFHVTDANGCTKSASTYVGYDPSDSSCFCTIEGYVYQDNNSNCVKDAGEAGLQNIQIHCSGIGYAYTNSTGHYSFIVPSGSYTLSESVLSFYPLAACQSNSIVVNAVAASGCVNTVNFANLMNPYHDLKINTWDLTYPVPGFSHTQLVLTSNMGSVTESTVHGGYSNDGQLGLATPSPSLPFVLSAPNWFSTTSTSGTSIAPAVTTTYQFNYTVPVGIPLGTSVITYDTIARSSNMTDWLNDYSPWDNVQTKNSVIVGPYDPNFKQVSPQGQGPDGQILVQDSVLDYMIHFQNLGTYDATDVVILDTLDSNLDWTSLRPVHHSKPCEVTINENGVAKFEFKNIHLKPKGYFNDELTQGYATYTIKTKKGLPYGTQFKNNASIYFDFNAPIQTNTTVNTLVQALTTQNICDKQSSMTLYPNPANDEINITFTNKETNQSITITVTDINGKEQYKSTAVLNAGKKSISINTSTFASGIYFVTLNDGKVSQTEKFVKLK